MSGPASTRPPTRCGIIRTGENIFTQFHKEFKDFFSHVIIADISISRGNIILVESSVAYAWSHYKYCPRDFVVIYGRSSAEQAIIYAITGIWLVLVTGKLSFSGNYFHFSFGKRKTLQ